MRPKAKRNGMYGYRAMVEFDDGRPSITVHKTVYPAKHLAEAAAKQWILAHKDNPLYRDDPTTKPPNDPDPSVPAE